MGDENIQDANTDTQSSSESNVDVNTQATASSAGGEATQSTDANEQTLEQYVDQELAAAQAARESGSRVEPNAGEKEEEGTETAEGTKPDAAKDDDGKEPPPFHEHPRWKEMVTERNTFRDQVKAFEAEKPLAETQRGIVQYCQDNRISPEQFQQALSLAALINSNPAEALKQLQPIVQRLEEFDGSRLPADLENEVAEGNLKLERAQEIAALRAQNKNGEFRGRLTAAQVEQQAFNANAQALGAWEQSTMRSDPDFKPKADAGGVDGKYELVVNQFRGLMAVTPPRTPQELVALVQKAYDSVSRVFATRLTPTKPTGKQLRSGQSAGKQAEKSPEQYESYDDLVAALAQKHGYS